MLPALKLHSEAPHYSNPNKWCQHMIIFIHFTLYIGDTLTEDEVMTIINAADKDGDGSLSYEEFVKIMMG